MILCEFLCKNCRKPIVLPRHMLLQAFVHPDIQPTGIPRVALVCNRCTIVENYSEADLAGSVEGDIVRNWEDIAELSCVEGTCQFRLPLFVLWNEPTSAKAKSDEMRIWRWRPLTCEAGHEVRKPEELIGYRLQS